MTPGRTGVPLRYDSLLELLSTTRIESLYLAGVESLAYRCSDFAKGIVRTNVCSNLTSFEYACRIYSEDQTLLANILKACPRLTVLRLGSFNCDSTVLQELTDAIVKLQNLEALRLFRCSSEFRGAIKNFFCAFPRGRSYESLFSNLGGMIWLRSLSGYTSCLPGWSDWWWTRKISWASIWSRSSMDLGQRKLEE